MKNLKSFAAFQAEVAPKIEETMVHFIEQQTNDLKLKESMLYSITAGGKRIRPLLMAATHASFGKKTDLGVYQIASALEMIHTYSLIHDDLPAMDDDALRRGNPTNHKVFGEALAILAGDGLLTLAFQQVAYATVPETQKILLLQQLSSAAGTKGMVAGQAADIQGETKALTLPELAAIHQRKTGALICFAVTAGGILAQQPQAVIDELACFANHLGLAFQIRDDLLDVIGTTAELGKETQRDAQLAKSTYPGILGVDQAKQALTNELNKAAAIVTKLGDNSFFDGALLQTFVQQFRLVER